MQIPWKLKSRAYRLMSHMPNGVLYFAQRNITRRARVNITEIHQGWAHHLKVADAYGSKRLIEFGAGKTLAQNLILSTVLENQVVVDLNRMVELEMVNQAIAQLSALGVPLRTPYLESLEHLEEAYKISYRAPYDMRQTDFEPGRFDFCASTNTLEHIPGKAIADIFYELYRILEPGGIVSAMIDYSDHYAHSDPSITRLNYLQFSRAEFERYNHENHYQNRLRHGHHKVLMTAPGFEIREENPTDVCAVPPGLTLRDDLLAGDRDDTSTTGFWVLQKPQPTGS